MNGQTTVGMCNKSMFVIRLLLICLNFEYFIKCRYYFSQYINYQNDNITGVGWESRAISMLARSTTRHKLRREKTTTTRRRGGESSVEPFQVRSRSAEHMTERSATRRGERRRWEKVVEQGVKGEELPCGPHYFPAVNFSHTSSHPSAVDWRKECFVAEMKRPLLSAAVSMVRDREALYAGTHGFF